MISNEVLHYLVNEKFGLFECSITNDGDSFEIKGNNGELFTDKDFTKKELSDAIAKLDQFRENQIAENKNKKTAILEKLGLTEEEAKLLLS